jgi:methyl-accepting chemotaxis protein
MTRSFSLCEGRARWGAAAALLAAAAAGALIHPAIAAAGCAAGAAVLALGGARPPAPDTTAEAAAAELARTAERVVGALRAATRGDQEARIAPGPESAAARALADAANDFLDISDAFVRESGAALDHVSRGIYHRKFLARGMSGAHARAATLITDGTLAMGSRQRGFAAMTGRFETEVMGIAEDFGLAAAELRETAGRTAATVARAGGDAETIDRRAGEAAEDAAAVADAAGRLRAAVEAVTNRTRKSRDMAERAAADVAETRRNVARMTEGAKRIAAVLELVHEVNEQTNLLAVNAMIEAARAGQAGAGFMVVAREVQALAGRTLDAAREIEAQTRETAEAADVTQAAAGKLETAVAQLTRQAAETAADAEDQAAAVGQIVDRIGGLNAAAGQVSQLAAKVSSAVSEAAVAFDEVDAAAAGLGGRADTLVDALRRYLEGAKAA